MWGLGPVSELGGAERGRGEGCLAPGKYLETTLTFDPWKLLLFFGSEKVDVSELLGSVGNFRF